MSLLDAVDPESVRASSVEGPSLVIAGSRSFGEGLPDELAVEYVRDAVAALGVDIAEVVSGGARGADTAGEQFAAQAGLPVERFEPDWDQYGNVAGHRRNVRMAHYGNAVLAFWDGTSSGTRSMIEYGCEVLGEQAVAVELYRETDDPAPVLASDPAVQRRL